MVKNGAVLGEDDSVEEQPPGGANIPATIFANGSSNFNAGDIATLSDDSRKYSPRGVSRTVIPLLLLLLLVLLSDRR
jgi:hypothetical protein